jgi:hypothetical protein
MDILVMTSKEYAFIKQDFPNLDKQFRVIISDGFDVAPAKPILVRADEKPRNRAERRKKGMSTK